MVDAAALFEMRLVITDSISTSKTLDVLTLEEDPMITILLKSYGGYEYFKPPTKKLKLATIQNKRYLISYENHFNWEIQNEEKVIQNYTCYKAVTVLDNEEVVAWFCPSFQFSEGHLHYDGLPGLIFELQTTKLTYYLKSINPNSKTPPDTIPNLKPISEAEFDKLVNTKFKR